MGVYLVFSTFWIFILFLLGLPPQHLYYNPPEGHTAPSPSSAPKYHENGQDTFSDFVTLVCQEAGGPIPPGPSRSPKVSVSSYYSPSMYPPPPPMSRPVALVRSTDLASNTTSSPPVSTSPGDHHIGYDLMPPILPPGEHHPSHNGRCKLNHFILNKLHLKTENFHHCSTYT